jgi:hypothetical protein
MKVVEVICELLTRMISVFEVCQFIVEQMRVKSTVCMPLPDGITDRISASARVQHAGFK